MKKKRKGKIGSSFDAFLKEEGMYEDVEATAIKRILAWQIQKEMTPQSSPRLDGLSAKSGTNSTPESDKSSGPSNHWIEMDASRASHPKR